MVECPGQKRVSNNGKWYIPIGMAESDCTFCEECFNKYIKDTDFKVIEKENIKDCNCDFSLNIWKKINKKKYDPEKIKTIILNNKFSTLKLYDNNDNEKKEEGHLYIIQEREFLNSNKDIYKIGRSNDINTRLMKYPKDSKIIFIIKHEDTIKTEKLWIERLKKNSKIKWKNDIGKEYFEGKYNIIILELMYILILNQM
jgi:hypothetical protein